MLLLKQLKLYIITTAILFCSLAIAGQTVQQIDSLIIKTHYQNHSEGNVKGATETAFEAIRLSEKIGYEGGIEPGLYTIAVLLSDNQDFEKSIEYIEKAKKYRNFLSKNPNAEFNLLMLQASNHYELGFYSQAASYYHQAKDAILREKDSRMRNYGLMILYMSARLAYEDLDAQYVYYLKAKELSDQAGNIFPEKYPPEAILAKKMELYEKMGYCHLEKAAFDSARYYYNIMLETAEGMQNRMGEALALASLGMVLEQEKKYEDALVYLTKAEVLLKDNAIFSNLKIIYDVKHRLYAKTGNVEKEREYLHLYKQLSDSLDNAKDKGRNKTIINLVNEKETELEEINTKHQILLYSLIGLGIIAIGGTYYFFHQYRKRKEKVLSAHQNQLVEQQQQLAESTQALNEKLKETEELHSEISKTVTELAQKEQETRVLHQKLKETFDEIIAMAKENHPQFWTRFGEARPTFSEKILTVNPDLKISELTLAAYIYLGFSTKEIAEYTFKSAKTIENNRSNLRKRLNLSSEEDFSIWLNKLMQ